LRWTEPETLAGPRDVTDVCREGKDWGDVGIGFSIIRGRGRPLGFVRGSDVQLSIRVVVREPLVRFLDFF